MVDFSDLFFYSFLFLSGSLLGILLLVAVLAIGNSSKSNHWE